MDEGSWEDLKRGVSVKVFFFLVLPHVSAPLDMASGEEQPIKQGCQRQSSFFTCCLLLGLSRAETHLGKEGLALRRFISLYMPFHSLLYVREIRLVG